MNCDFWSLKNVRQIAQEIIKYPNGFYKFPLGWAVTEEVQRLIAANKISIKDRIQFQEATNRRTNPAILFPNNSVVKAVKNHMEKYEKLATDIASHITQLENGENDRIFFGSFYKPRADYREVAKMLLAGESDEDVHKKYRIETMELAGVKAALKRGSYEDIKIELERKSKNIRKAEPLEVKVNQTPVRRTKNIEKKSTDYNAIPYRDYKELTKENKISENQLLRMQYFRQDTKNLTENRKKQLYDSIAGSKWFEDFKSSEISDLKVYTFFDDLMLDYVTKRKELSPEKVKSIWGEIKNSKNLCEIVPLKEDKPQINLKPKKLDVNQNQEIYDYIVAGFPDEEIMKTFNLTKKQLGARKAWITMRATP
jgi:uncharacterized protein (DUF433 family)